MAKLILNLHSTFLIFPVLAIDQLFLYLFPIGWLDRLLCAFMIGAGESAIYIRIKEAAGWSPCGFMMWHANVLSTIHILKAPSSLLSAFMKKIILLRRYLECGVLN
jgi:hypothetical protein